MTRPMEVILGELALAQSRHARAVRLKQDTEAARAERRIRELRTEQLRAEMKARRRIERLRKAG